MSKSENPGLNLCPLLSLEYRMLAWLSAEGQVKKAVRRQRLDNEQEQQSSE